MIKHDVLKIWEILQIWEALNAKNLNAKFLIGNAFFNIMYGLSHRPDQIYHIWKIYIGRSLNYFEESL